MHRLPRDVGRNRDSWGRISGRPKGSMGCACRGKQTGQTPLPVPVDAPSAGPVWTVPAIVCGGRLLGRIVLAVSNLPRPLPSHRGEPRAGPRPLPPSRQTGRPAPRSHPTFQEQPPTHPCFGVLGLPQADPWLQTRRRGTPPPPSHLDYFQEWVWW